MASTSGRRVGSAAASALLLVVLLLLGGCRVPGGGSTPTPSAPSATPRPFTVMSTDPIRVTDPAAITDAASAVLAVNVFQRLMTADPGGSVLKPDLARDCLFTSATAYTCTLNKDLVFHNGHPVTSSDVKFSIERAARLNVAGSSASLLSSLRKIEIPDAETVRFLLSRPDTQFGWALASPAASIVDALVYDADTVASPKDPIVGSGPYLVAAYAPGQLQLTRFPDYVGRTPARIPNLVYRTVADSATLEDAMSKGTVDVVWRGLNSAALTRYIQQIQASSEQTTDNGYASSRLPGERVLQLAWSPRSSMRTDKALRQAIAVALQGDRTLDSVVPNGIAGHASSFPLGGKATPKVTWKNRINLTLGYDPTTPNGQDLATQIRTRLEDTGGLSVQLRRDDANADLQLLDRKAWTATALAWLQPYLDGPLPAAATTVSAVSSQYQAYCARPVAGCTTDDATANALLGALQRQAAVDQVLLPISQSDEYVFTRAGVSLNSSSYGPGWQLGFFGMSSG